MIKNLVLITDTYNWIAECSGYILLNPEKFEILQVFNDRSDIGSCNRLCREAVDIQRKHDLFKIGKEIGIKKVSTLDYDTSSIDINMLIIQLQLYIYMSKFSKVICQDSLEFFNDVILSISNKCTSEILFFGDTEKTALLEIQLDDEIIKRKKNLLSLMVGRPSKFFTFTKVEKFYSKET